MDKRAIVRYDKKLAEDMQQLGIYSFRPQVQKQGKIVLFDEELSKCTICETPTKTLLFLNKYGQGSAITVCKECLKKAIEVL